MYIKEYVNVKMNGATEMKSLRLFLIVCLAGFPACSLLNGGDGGGPRTIVFSAQDGGGTYQIYTMREDGSGVRQLTRGDYSSIAPSWSPDGERIAYARYTPDIGGDALWVMNADGSNQEPLVHNPLTGNPQHGRYPDWHPDGTRVAFEQCLNCEAGGDNYEIFVADLQSGAIDTLTKHLSSDRQPVWSPKGNSIVFESKRDYYQADTLRFRHDFYIVSTDDATLQRLTQTGYARSPVWDQDGNNIVFSSTSYSNGLFQLDLNNSAISKVEENLPNRLRLFPIRLSENEEKLLIAAMDYPDFSFYFLDIETNEAEFIPFESTQMIGADWFIPPDN